MKATIYLDGKRVEVEGTAAEINDLTSMSSKHAVPHYTKMIDLFVQKNWIKAYVPYGYEKFGKWLRIKNPIVTQPMIQRIFALVIEVKNLTQVANQVNKEYGLAYDSFDREGITTLCHDPIYIGKPEYMDTVVVDTTLQLINEEQFTICQKILSDIYETARSKEYGPFKDHQDTIMEFLLTKVRLICIDCGKSVVRNGTASYQGVQQQIFKCNGCGKQFRVPTLSQLRSNIGDFWE